jgi:hypothetical protein
VIDGGNFWIVVVVLKKDDDDFSGVLVAVVVVAAPVDRLTSFVDSNGELALASIDSCVVTSKPNTKRAWLHFNIFSMARSWEGRFFTVPLSSFSPSNILPRFFFSFKAT